MKRERLEANEDADQASRDVIGRLDGMGNIDAVGEA